MQFIVTFIVLSIILLSAIRLKVGIALYIAYLFLVPFMQIDIAGLSFQYNLVNSILFMLFIYEFKIKERRNIDFYPLYPFVFLYICQFILMPFQNEVPWDFMIDRWRMLVMKSLILFLIIWNLAKVDSSCVRLFRLVFVVCVIIASSYGLYLTTTEGNNPYLLAMTIVNGKSINEDYFIGEGRLFGRISSVFAHPMLFGLFLGLAFVYIYHIKNKLPKPLAIILLVQIALNIFFCGVRSVIGALALTSLVYLISIRNFKLIIISLISFFLFFKTLTIIPGFEEYIATIVDVDNKKSNIEGSSISLRIEQLDGCLKIIDDSPLVGKGYAWDAYYRFNKGDHPVLLAFESLIYIILCNTGVIGVLIWLCFIFIFFRNNKKITLDDSLIYNSLLFFYISYSMITGEYEYMPYFILIYVLMLIEIPFAGNCKKMK